ncbi:MAG: cytidine deaminase [bacterium]|nr:cytidine deaminase [bacterium]MCP4798806.1 cytidine deaminase [bacterium]
MKKELIDAARDVMQFSHSPYSLFRVGAAVLGDDGKVYTGTNVENASYGLSICAERAAVLKAVANGVKSISACAVTTDTAEPAAPCGACRQVLVEFGPNMDIYLSGKSGDIVDVNLSDLLPMPFTSFELE